MNAYLRVFSSFVLLAMLTVAGPDSLAAVGDKFADNVWTTISADELNTLRAASAMKPWIRPDNFTAAALQPEAITAVLASAPTILTLPRPDGGFERFQVARSSVMHPDLEKWMADQGSPMKTYSGKSLDNPATTVYLDWGGPAGFHALVRSPGADYFIDPYWQGDTRLYTSYFQRDYTLQGKGKPWSEIGYVEPASSKTSSAEGQSGTRAPTGGVLRKYRMAVAATAAYTSFNGGKVGAQAAIATSIGKLSLLYENELSVRLQLVANNQDIVYDGTGPNPFAGDDCFLNNDQMLGENQAYIDGTASIGSAGYDIGHVFGKQATPGGGGLAGFGVVCSSGSKARGCSSSSNPQGDGFDLGLMAHEVGHQFAASHTFNGTDSNCAVPNWGGTDNAYEPGSGSTIMAYGGICGVDNIGPPDDGYFHRRSLDQMGTFVNGAGSCFDNNGGAIVNASEPVVSAGADYTIPKETPFELTGTGSDADGDALTFTWEQFDKGTHSPLATGDDGVQPIFRSFPPTTTGNTRVFPRPGPPVPGETLPTTNRTMHFQLTARDNRTGGGREKSDEAEITSTTTAGPFAVTVPNGTETYFAGATPTVTWNVAGTNVGAVNTPNVDILLSHDGGLTYAETLATNTPNDGSEGVAMPTTVSSSTALIKVKGSGNVFFDVSDANFSVDEKCNSPALAFNDAAPVSNTITIPGGKTIGDLNVKLDLSHPWVADLIVTLEHVPTATSVTLIDKPGIPATAQGCTWPDINVDFDDEASAPAENQCAFQNPPAVNIKGRLTPINPLSAFDTKDVGGDWKLTITDVFANGDNATLNKWCVDAWFGTPTVGCPATQPLTGTISGSETFKASVSATLGPVTINGTNIVVQAPTIIIGNDTTIGGTFKAVNAGCT